ncbi:MAG: hypothetical protein KME17_10775 [Cyanosarcina radialis HA8281-LM2]|jgi:hypothetical protein|nr:hypothetical protein [Cyanosarcina radialis HA8281-LM2]
MKTEPSISALRPSLGLLWLSYAFLGWYLAAHHVIWLVGAFAVLLSLAIAWQGRLLLVLLRLGSQQLLVMLTIILVSIGLLYLLVTPSVLPTLILIPLLASFLADIEMRFIGWSQRRRLLLSTCIAVVGLGLGEIVDLTLLPSIRF